jgi:cytoskeletal protein CcmA (bactofilin family)
MFSKSNKEAAKTQAPPAAPQKRSAPSIISGDLRVVGDLNSEGEIQVDGSVDGDIRSKDLLVGETATVKGEIVADTIRIFGTVNGQIKARSVTLAKTSHVVGDIHHTNLSIEEGAFLEGHCKRMAEKTEPVEGKINLLVKDPPTATPPGAPPKGDATKERVTST